MDLINFKSSLGKSDDFEPIYFADPMTYVFQIGIINLILINQKILNSDPSISLYNQRVMRVKLLDHRPPEFPFSYEINTVVPAITFSINESHLNLSSNWMFFFEQIRKRIYR